MFEWFSDKDEPGHTEYSNILVAKTTCCGKVLLTKQCIAYGHRQNIPPPKHPTAKTVHHQNSPSPKQSTAKTVHRQNSPSPKQSTAKTVHRQNGIAKTALPRVKDFKHYTNELSQAKYSKESCLYDMSVVEFRNGLMSIFFKKKNYSPASKSSPRGVLTITKRNISNLVQFMSQNRLEFYDLTEYVLDLIDV